MKTRALVWASILLSLAAISRAADEAPAGLPMGKYRVWHNQAILYRMELKPDGKYLIYEKLDGKPTGEGTYAWDKDTGVVTWKTGINAEKKYTGDFRTDHVIRLNLTFYGYNPQEKFAVSDNTKPRAGRYTVHRGAFSFTLDGNGKYARYEIGDKPVGEGTYEYDAKEKMLRWTSGIHKDKGFRGTFSIDQKIVMSDRVYAEYYPF